MQTTKTIQFEIVTPEKSVLKDSITQVTLPTEAGEITVMPDHIPLVSNLRPGVIAAKNKDNQDIVMSVSGGFIEVIKDKIIILADTAERAEDIDLKRVEEARKQAEDSKKNIKQFDRVQFANITSKLAKELARERAANKWKKD